MGQGEALTAADVESDRDRARPRVVVIVDPRRSALPSEEPAESSPALESPAMDAPAAIPAAASPSRKTGPQPATSRVGRPGVQEEEQPTTRFPSRAPSRPRGPEDERLVAAVVPLDWGGQPGPLSDFLGQSLLFRAARAAATAGAPRLILVGRIPDHLKRRVYDEAYAGFLGKPVELMEVDPTPRDLGTRGRVLVLDCRALHDPDAVKRLAEARGPRAVLLLGRYGEGLRVRTQEGRVVETGAMLENADGRIAGACSVPVETYLSLCGVGELAALENLGATEELVAVVAPRTFSQQFGSVETYQRAQALFFDRIASGGGKGLFDELFGSRLSRRLTLALLHTTVTPASVSVWAALLALVGAALVAVRDGWGAIAGGVFLILSAVLDRVDGELARLRLDEDAGSRYLDFGLDHLTHMLAFLALAWSVERNRELDDVARTLPVLVEQLRQWNVYGAIILGCIASAGVLLLGLVLIWRGPPSQEPQPALTSLGDFLASSFGSRDYFYLLLAATGVGLALPHVGVMGFFLLLTTALVHVVWVSLLLLTAIAPRRD